MRRRPLPLLLLAAATMLAPVPASAADVAALARQEARLATTGWRLTTASAGWCPAIAPQPGWILSDPRRFDPGDRPDAERTYATRGDGPFIAAIAPGSPAARAGLTVGTRLIALEGIPIPIFGDGPTLRIDAVIAMLAVHDPAAPLALTDGDGAVHRLDAAPGCASAFRVERGGAQAAANGQLVRIRLDLAQSIADDAEFAAVVAHELAHNILRHRARLAHDRSIERVRATEIEADRLSVWLLADAGYDPLAAVRFWQRHKKPLVRSATHPPRSKRIAAIEAEVAAMRTARVADPTARPALLAAPAPLE